MLPISVLVPTRNSISLLPRHLETMRPWMGFAAEIIAVDSESEDGTWELLRSSLPPERTRFFQHPSGLYESWNFGIRQARSPFLYVSTVGDRITPEGLAHLVETATSLSCDVVVSPPGFVDDQEQPIQANPWPVHRLVSFFNLSRAFCLEGVIPFAGAISYIPFAMLGSAASNLYRTEVLQGNPFPTDFGSNGDGAWGVFNLLNTRFGITPRSFSFFMKHDRPYRKVDGTLQTEERMFARGLKIWETTRRCRPDLQAQADRLGFERLIEAKKKSQFWRARLLEQRSKVWPWILNPIAWRARIRRDNEQRHCDALLRRMLQIAANEGFSSIRPSTEPALT